MLETGFFETKYVYMCHDLKDFLETKGIKINIYMDYMLASKLDPYPTQFLSIEYPKEIKLLIDYWIFSNNIKFHDKIQ